MCHLNSPNQTLWRPPKWHSFKLDLVKIFQVIPSILLSSPQPSKVPPPQLSQPLKTHNIRYLAKQLLTDANPQSPLSSLLVPHLESQPLSQHPHPAHPSIVL